LHTVPRWGGPGRLGGTLPDRARGKWLGSPSLTRASCNAGRAGGLTDATATGWWMIVAGG